MLDTGQKNMEQSVEPGETSHPLLKQILEAGKNTSKDNQDKKEDRDSDATDWKQMFNRSKDVGPSIKDVLPWLSPGPTDETETTSHSSFEKENQEGMVWEYDSAMFDKTEDAMPWVSGPVDLATGAQGFTCEVCGRCFAQKRYLKRHMAVHGDGRCEACERGECLLKEHTSSETYECDVCGKSFTRKSSLVRHCRVHAGERPFVCNVCNKSFTQGSDLGRHARIHTAEKPFECEVCRKAFARKNSLTRHRHVHSGQKPYACEICNKRFALRTHLRSHKRIYTGEKPYECEVCLKVFSHSSTMQRHRLTHERESCDMVAHDACKLEAVAAT